MKALAGRAAAGTAVVAAAGAAHTLWLRGTFTSRLEAATQAQAGQVPACVLSGGDVVEVQIIEHLSAAQDQEENAVQYVLDLYERWRLAVRGDDPLDY